MSKPPIKFEKFLALIVSFGLASFFVWLAFSDQALKSTEGKKVKDIIGEASQYFTDKKTGACDSVVTNCDLTIEEKAEVCRPGIMYETIRQKLQNPLSFQQCQDAKNRLAQLCESNCPLDPQSVLSVPGGIKLDVRRPANDIGEDDAKTDECIVRGRRSVVFRGICGG